MTAYNVYDRLQDIMERIRIHPSKVGMLGTGIGVVLFGAACADQSTPAIPAATAIPEQSKISATATAIATSTPKLDLPTLSPEQQAQIVERSKHVRDFMREFLREGFSHVAINPGDTGDEDYARFWAKFNPDPHKTLTHARTGPDGILGFRVTNTYSDTGKLLQSNLSADFIMSGHGEIIRQYIPQIGEHVQGQPGYQQIPFDHLRQVAEGVFNLPRMNWQETTSTYEAGIQVPTLKGSGITAAAGSNVEFTIDSFGHVSLTKTYPFANLSFKQRLNPYKFAKNGHLKPQFAPRKLSL